MISEWGCITNPSSSRGLGVRDRDINLSPIISGDLYVAGSLKIDNLPSYLFYVEHLMSSNDMESAISCIRMISNKYRGASSSSVLQAHVQPMNLESSFWLIREIIESDLCARCPIDIYTETLLSFSHIASTLGFSNISVDLCVSAADSDSSPSTSVLCTLARLQACEGNFSAALIVLNRITSAIKDYTLENRFTLKLHFWQVHLLIALDRPLEAQECLMLVRENIDGNSAVLAENYRTYLWAMTEYMVTGKFLTKTHPFNAPRQDEYTSAEEKLDALWSSAWIAYQSGEPEVSASLFDQLRNAASSGLYHQELALEGLDYCHIKLGDFRKVALQLETTLGRIDAGEYISSVGPVFRCIESADAILTVASVGKIGRSEINSRLRRRVQRFFPNSLAVVVRTLEMEAQSMRTDGFLPEAGMVRSAIDGLLKTSAQNFGRPSYDVVNRLWQAVLSLESQEPGQPGAISSTLVDEIGSTGDSSELHFVARVCHLVGAVEASGTELMTLAQQFENDVNESIRKNYFDLWMWAASTLVDQLVKAGRQKRALLLMEKITLYPEYFTASVANRYPIQLSFGKCFYAQRRYLEALGAYTAAYELRAVRYESDRPELLGLQLDIADCQAKLGEYRKAMSAYRTIWAMRSKDIEPTDDIQRRAILGYANSLERLGAYKGAAMNYGRVRMIDAVVGDVIRNDTLEILFGQARCWERNGSLFEAAEAYQHLLDVWATVPVKLRVPLDHIRHRLACCQGPERIMSELQSTELASIENSPNLIILESSNARKTHHG